MSELSSSQLLIKRFRNRYRTIKSLLHYICSKPNRLYLFPQYVLEKYFRHQLITSPLYFNGNVIVLDPDSGIDRTIFFQGVAHEEMVKFILSHLENDSVFFDIGSHSGYFSLLATTLIKTGYIHAFEPITHLYNNTLLSIKLNNIQNIQVNKTCVGNKNGTVSFYQSTQTDASGMKRTEYQSGTKTITVPITTLTSYIQKKKVKRLDMIKIDVEGAEKDILLSSRNIFKQFKPIIIVELINNTARAFNYHPNEIYDFLVDIGYTIYIYNQGTLKKTKRLEYYEDNFYCFYTSSSRYKTK